MGTFFVLWVACSALSFSGMLFLMLNAHEVDPYDPNF